MINPLISQLRYLVMECSAKVIDCDAEDVGDDYSDTSIDDVHDCDGGRGSYDESGDDEDVNGV